MDTGNVWDVTTCDKFREAMHRPAPVSMLSPFGAAESRPYHSCPMARARAAMRRSGPTERALVGFGDITIDRSTYRARGPKGQVLLTAKEFELLQYIITNASEVLPRKKLLLHVWGYDFDPGTNVLEVALSRVRHRLNEITDSLRLRTLRGQGVLLEFIPADQPREDEDVGPVD